MGRHVEMRYSMCACLAGMFVLLGGGSVAGLDQEIIQLTDTADELITIAEGEEAEKISVAVKGKSKIKSTAPKYAQIPNFVLRHMAEEMKVANQDVCEKKCSKQKSCLSYSYRSKDKLCVTSIEALHYRYDWTFYTKVHEMDAFGKWKHKG